jgi:hypothetical protein
MIIIPEIVITLGKAFFIFHTKKYPLQKPDFVVQTVKYISSLIGRVAGTKGGEVGVRVS